MRLISGYVSTAAAVAILFTGHLSAEDRSESDLFKADLSKLVVVGDSLSAGVQNFSLLDKQQPNGYASVIARQAGVSLVLPLIPFPGAPNVLQLTPKGIVPVDGTLPAIPRDNPCEQPTNVSVPGVTLEQALALVPTPTPSSDPVQGWVDIVLGFPNPFASAACHTSGPASTEIQQAVALKPTTVIEWLGNNDALVPALTGTLNTLTPLFTFATSYEAALDALAKTGAPIITATIPDVTKVPYFTPVASLAARLNMPVDTVARKLGIGTQDFLRPSAVPIAQSILSNGPGSLQKPCPVPLAGLPASSIPCVLTARDAERVRYTTDAYNFIIFVESITHGAVLVDIHGLVNNIARNGVTANGQHLTTAFLGGLFSLDGIHPSNTGYAVIANAFIQQMNESLSTAIPPANLDQIAASDPLVVKPSGGTPLSK